MNNNKTLDNMSYILVLLLLACLAMPSLAEFQYHGFVSQSVIMSDDNPFYDDEAGTHGNFRELGLNGVWELSEKLRFNGQLLSRKAGDIDNGDPEIDLLSLDYRFHVSNPINLGLRAGRLKNPFGLYNETRDIPHARVGVVVPQAVYFESFRDAVLRVDGLELYASGYNAIGDWTARINHGQADIEESLVEAQFFQTEILGEFREIDNRSTLYLQLEPIAISGLKLAFTKFVGDLSLGGFPQLTPQQQLQASMDIMLDPFSAFNYVTSLDLTVDLSVLSLEYRASKWAISAEYLDIDTETSNVTVLGQPGLPNSKDNSEAYYVQLEWNPYDQLSIYTRREWLYYDSDDRDGSGSASALGINPDGRFSRISSIGARYILNQSMSVAAHYASNTGFAHSVGSTSVDYSSFERDWKLCILQFEFHF
jgi:hypothetical protein